MGVGGVTVGQNIISIRVEKKRKKNKKKQSNNNNNNNYNNSDRHYASFFSLNVTTRIQPTATRTHLQEICRKQLIMEKKIQHTEMEKEKKIIIIIITIN